MDNFLPDTLYIGKKNLILPSCQSTNDVALALVRSGQSSDGLLVWALEQTAGRGQRGNQWLAEAGQNLTFSLALEPRFLLAHEQFYLSMALALGLRDALAPLLATQVKWPNDLYAGPRKLGGMLLENQLRGSAMSHSVAGIGLNVNQIAFPLPTATSLRLETGQEWPLGPMLNRLLGGIEARYLQLRHGRRAQLHADYHEALMGRNEWRRYGIEGQPVEGRIVAVEPSGHLLAEIRGQGTQRFGFKEISLWPSEIAS